MEKQNKESWKKIDDGLKALMAITDELSDAELHLKSKRLNHLSKFADQLSRRVNERLRQGFKEGSIDELFNRYHADREQVDLNA